MLQVNIGTDWDARSGGLAQWRLLGGSECWFWLDVLQITEPGSESGILLTQVGHGPRRRISLDRAGSTAPADGPPAAPGPRHAVPRPLLPALHDRAAEAGTIPCLKIVLL